MRAKQNIWSSEGFTLVGLLISFLATAVFALLVVSLANYQMQVSKRQGTVAAKDRIVAGVRSLAGSPAAIRNSMQAALGTSAVNPQLLSCAGGNPPNSCPSNTVFPLTLFSPVVAFAADGTLLGVQPVTSPSGAVAPARFDIWGSPCSTSQTNCPIMVTTSFQALCPPAQLTAAQLSVAVTSAELAPQAVCTVADTIEVTYTIQLDPTQIASNPELSSLFAPVTGSISTSVLLISGNPAQ